MLVHILLTVLRVIGIVLLAVLALILVVLLLPVGARVLYDQGDLTVWARCGPVKIKVLPKKKSTEDGTPQEETPSAEKKTKKERKQKKKKKSQEAKEAQSSGEAAESGEKPKKKFSVNREQIFYSLEKLPPIVGKLLKRVGRGIRFDPLKVHLLIAGKDPADTARLYGTLYGVLSALVPEMERLSFVKHQDVRLYVDFQRDKPDCIADVGVSIRPGVLVLAALIAGGGALRWFLGFRKLASPAEAADKADDPKPEHTENTNEAA